MYHGSDGMVQEECDQPQNGLAELLRMQMQSQGVSVRCLVAEGLIRKSQRNHFFRRVADGSLYHSEINAVMNRLSIDPIRAAIAINCFRNPETYEDPCLATTAELATSLAVELTEELAACAGNFQPLRKAHCKGLAKRTAAEIAQNHARMEQSLDDFAYGARAFG